MKVTDLVTRPCPRQFAEMKEGRDPGTRLCEACDTMVHDLSLMNRREARALLEEKNGDICIRVVHDISGHAVFRDTVPASRLMRGAMALALVASPFMLEACGGAAPRSELPYEQEQVEMQTQEPQPDAQTSGGDEAPPQEENGQTNP
jgi:hypothetical protein